MDKFEEIVSQWEVPRAQSKEEAWEQLSGKIDLKETEEKKIRPLWRRRLIPVAAAASIALILWAVFAPSSKVVKHTTLAGDHSSVELPDGSTVELNASSELEYDAIAWEDAREVQLKGEGFFDVAPGSSFVVKTEQGNVEVLGTSFNVFQRENTLEVACYSGKVSVKRDQEEKSISPGECVRCDSGKMKLLPFDTAGSDWRNGHYSFDGASLNRVLAEIAIQYNLDIKHNDFSDRPFYGSFKVNEKNSKEALSIICKAMNLDYKFQDGNRVVISERN